MKAFIERAWQHGHPLMWLLAPLSALYWFITTIRRVCYRLGIKKSYSLNVPVIVVGNLTVGGNGKTPVVVWLAKLLQSQGLTVGIISRGYGGSATESMIVDTLTDTAICGDEPKLIVNQTQCLMAVGRDRVATGELLISTAGQRNQALDIIISDDGLQHYRLKRDIEIVVVDGLRRFGNNLLLPMGPMREGQWRANDATLIINNGGDSQHNEELMTLAPQCARYVDGNAEINNNLLTTTPLVACAGIGYPQRFFDTLSTLGYNTVAEHGFADHQPYTNEMLAPLVNDDQLLIMTEKDAVKCQSFAKHNWIYLPVEAQLTNRAQQKILARLKEIL